MSPPPQSIRIKYHGVFTQKARVEIIPLRSVVVEDEKIDDSMIELKLKIVDSPGIFIVMPPTTFFTIDAIEIFRE